MEMGWGVLAEKRGGAGVRYGEKDILNKCVARK